MTSTTPVPASSDAAVPPGVPPGSGTGGGRAAARRYLRLPLLRRAIGRKRAIWWSAGLLLLIYGLCFLIPAVNPDSDALSGIPFQGPSLAHIFGTDSLGRDMFVRTFAAGRIDITVGLGVVAFSMLVGTILGAFSAMSRRWVDAVLMRIVDALIAFPYLVTILVLVVIVGPDAQIGPTPRGLTAILIAFLALGWTFYARLSRGQALSIRNRDYVVATRVLGYSGARVLFRHVIPGVVRVLLAYAVSDAIVSMGALASFAFLGVGVQAPTAEWGAIMYEGRAYLGNAWWIEVFPGALLTITGLVLSVLADGLNADGDN